MSFTQLVVLLLATWHYGLDYCNAGMKTRGISIIRCCKWILTQYVLRRNLDSLTKNDQSISGWWRFNISFEPVLPPCMMRLARSSCVTTIWLADKCVEAGKFTNFWRTQCHWRNIRSPQFCWVMVGFAPFKVHGDQRWRRLERIHVRGCSTGLGPSRLNDWKWVLFVL